MKVHPGVKFKRGDLVYLTNWNAYGLVIRRHPERVLLDRRHGEYVVLLPDGYAMILILDHTRERFSHPRRI
jgi:hypothetical protein